MTSKIGSDPLSIIGICVIGILILPIIWLIFREIFWRLFKFDKDVDKALGRVRSSEVKTGRIVEQLAPLIDRFPVDINKPGTSLVFLGQPIDYIFFDPEVGITFIEVKSGKSNETLTQKKIKKLIENGSIYYSTFRVS